MRLAALITLLLPLTASAQFQGPDIAEIDRQAAENRRALDFSALNKRRASFRVRRSKCSPRR